MFELPCEPPAVGGFNFMTFNALQGVTGRYIIDVLDLFGGGLVPYTPTHAGHDSAIGCRTLALPGPVMLRFDKSPSLPKWVQCYVSTDDPDGKHPRPVRLRAYGADNAFLSSDTSRGVFGPAVDGAKFVNLGVNHDSGIAWCWMDPAAAESDKLILGTITAGV